ncbi:hypothetical protein [Rhodoferax sp.]|uniref:hypothetical protein n=1 Tax=Rhodoferax sp. TaxID=50421 RepID=UPI0025EA2569|nr:hypothetical protein [Rhodoferax sp.]
MMPKTTKSLGISDAHRTLMTPAIKTLYHHGLRSKIANSELGAILYFIDAFFGNGNP